MDIHDLTVFAAAARHGSVTKAAQSLSTVQSNVTTRIRLLESELRVQLFHRNHRGITLTRKGQQLLPYAQQMLSLVEHARAAMSDAHDVRGTLQIGALQSTASARLPEVLKAYAARHARVDISVETGSSAELVDKVLESRLDGAFVSGFEDHPALDVVTSFVEELVIITPTTCRSVRAYLNEATLPKLLVFKVGCHYRQRLERYLGSEGASALTLMEFGTIDGIIGCVAAGLGVSMLPRSVIERSARRNEVAVHRLAKAHRYVETQFVTHKAHVRSLALNRLIDVITDERSKPARMSPSRARTVPSSSR
jgi:LysR family transcriptional regulator, cell division regulator